MMDFVPGGQLGHRLLAFSRLQRHLGLESWAVLPTSLRHFLFLPDSNSCPQFRSGTPTRLPVQFSGSTLAGDGTGFHDDKRKSSIVNYQHQGLSSMLWQQEQL